MQEVTKDRDKYIGGSDIPIIMGLSPFKTRWQLLQEKAGLVESDFNGNKYTEYGNEMEPVIRDFINLQMDYPFEEHKVIERDMRYHADGYDNEDRTVLEIKTTSKVFDDLAGYRKYLVQLLYGMELYDAPVGILAVYHRPDDFSPFFDENRLQTFKIWRCDFANEISKIMESVELFRNDLERLRADPALTEEDLQPTDIVVIADRCTDLEVQLSFYKEIEAKLKEAKQELKVAMEKHNIKTWTTNFGSKITLVPDGEDKLEMKFNEKKLKEEQPDLYDRYCTMEKKSGKKGYVRITLPKNE